MKFRPNIDVSFGIPTFNRTDRFDATTKTDEPYNLATGILCAGILASAITSFVLLYFELITAAIVVSCVGGACLIGAIVCASIASYKRNIEITERNNSINNRMMNMQQQYLNHISQSYNNRFIPPQDNIQRQFTQQTPGFNGNNNQINIGHRQMNNDQNNNFNLSSSNNINNSNNMIGGGN